MTPKAILVPEYMARWISASGGISVSDVILLFAAFVALFVPFAIRTLERRDKAHARNDYKRTLATAIQWEVKSLNRAAKLVHRDILQYLPNKRGAQNEREPNSAAELLDALSDFANAGNCQHAQLEPPNVISDFQAWAGVFETEIDFDLASVNTRLREWNAFADLSLVRGSASHPLDIGEEGCNEAFGALTSVINQTISLHRKCREVKGQPKSVFDLS